jgi:hypothetical protein
VAEAELTAALGQSRRCDVLVAQVGEYVAMEASVQTLPRTVAAAGVASIRAMAEGPQEEADQRPRIAPPAGLEPATCRIDLDRLVIIGGCRIIQSYKGINDDRCWQGLAVSGRIRCVNDA